VGAGAAAAVPRGGPSADTSAHVTDRTLRPVPTGIPGELVIGGDGLARGYWKRPAITAERFIPDPFSNLPGARLYKTGDLVRLDATGRIDFQGRFDHQVKIRGFRIELGEIESRLARHPAVAAQVVVAREDVPGSQRLVAYAVPEEGASLDHDALRKYLADSLPVFMVPTAVVVLDALPLNPSGKVDRAKLPAPEEAPSSTSAASERPAFVPPRGPLEEMVAGAFRELLPVTRVGAHDGFFDLGGH
jgi:acyl-CoA synthetase (AMP-forming)/AMP-acid ligase II